jgi:hypothetical protein
MRDWRIAALVLGAAALGGCGGSSASTPKLPSVQAARTFALADFAAKADAGRPRLTTVSFAIRQPDGQPLTDYRRGSGPHTGVHLILVRTDLAYIVHRHPPIAADGTIRDTIAFPAPGRYRAVVDAYPNTTATVPQRNFQLFRTITVPGSYRPQPLPAFRSTVDVAGYRFTLHGRPQLRAIQAAFLTITVTTPDGRPASFTPWYGALAHAVFFRRGSLDYFHTHVCSIGATGCTSLLGPAAIAGRSSAPGKLTVGVLVPVPGTWRLFLQCKVAGKVLTAPFTLVVR